MSNRSVDNTRESGPWWKRVIGAVVLCAVMTLILRTGVSAEPDGNSADGNESVPLKKLIADLRRENDLVGLAAMVMVDGKIIGAVADGERKIDSKVPVRTSDRWHVGSITKSITATMVGRLVDAGKLCWTDTIGECFSDAAIHDDWKPVTLRQLLTHTAGAPANFPEKVSEQRPVLGAASTQARREAVLEVMAVKPAGPPGQEHVYSNVGYTIAGAIAEQVTGLGWEQLIRQEVFTPLKLKSGGFGPPKVSGRKVDQPLGHYVVDGRKVSGDIDNTPIIGPAGTVHLTLSDLCLYATEHLRGELGQGKLLTAETFKQLHTPERANYACGWGLIPPTYSIPHVQYWHNGSNTLWYALVVFIPTQNLVVAVTSNDGDMDKAEEAAWKIVHAASAQQDTQSDNAARREALPDSAFPKQSPFSAVRWSDAQPEVMVGHEWFVLVSIDGVAAGEIVAFCKTKYEAKWQKRFEEDLFVVLFRMGHPPAETVKLVVRPVGSTDERTLENVAMTEENRRRIRKAASDQ